MRRLLKSVGLPLVVGVLMGLSAPVKADSGSDQIDKAASAFSALDFEGALQYLEQAHGMAGNGREELIRIYALGGLCLASLGRMAEAEKSFAAVLSIDPAYRLGDDISPRYREPFLKVLKKGVARLAVSVTVPNPLTLKEPVSVELKLLADPVGLARKLSFRYRRGDQGKFSSVRVKLGVGKAKSFYLPPGIWRDAGLQPLKWYAELRDRFGGLLLQKGSASHPVTVAVVKPKPKMIPALSGLAAGRASVKDEDSSWYQRWWVWAIVGGVAVAAAGGTVAAMSLSVDAPEQRSFTLDIQ